jgi:hypothetical protein
MTVIIRRSFLLGRDAGEAVTEAQRETLVVLVEHDLKKAALALTAGTPTAFFDFMTMRGAMLAGGLHRVRLNGGRGIDR